MKPKNNKSIFLVIVLVGIAVISSWTKQGNLFYLGFILSPILFLLTLKPKRILNSILLAGVTGLFYITTYVIVLGSTGGFNGEISIGSPNKIESSVVNLVALIGAWLILVFLVLIYTLILTSIYSFLSYILRRKAKFSKS